MSDSDDPNLPSAKECDERCKQFAEITGTDTALAMFYLQDRDWNLDQALNAFFEGSGRSNFDRSDRMTSESSKGNSAGGTSISFPKEEGSTAKKLKTEHTNRGDNQGESGSTGKRRFRLMSWNIDGLDTETAVKRTHTVCEIINKEDPHAVLLQEVVDKTQEVIESQCPTYQIIPGGHREYFTAIMLKAGAMEYENMAVTEYPNTVMMRNLLCVKCKYEGIPLSLMTSHLESTAEYGAERKAQLKIAFDKVTKEEATRTVIFGGDLNLRDKELAGIGGLPGGVLDIWEATGSRPEAKYTWDMSRNDNLVFNGKYKPKCRFDRLYIRQSNPCRIKPVYFELVGLEKVRKYGRFPSDHWGLLTHHDIL